MCLITYYIVTQLSHALFSTEACLNIDIQLNDEKRHYLTVPPPRKSLYFTPFHITYSRAHKPVKVKYLFSVHTLHA